MNQNKINIAVLGASGYTGGDLIKILLNHDYVNISALSANSKLGMNPSNVHASLFNAQLPDFVSLDEIDFTQIDLVISGLPHNNLHNMLIYTTSIMKLHIIHLNCLARPHMAYQKFLGTL